MGTSLERRGARATIEHRNEIELNDTAAEKNGDELGNQL
jgi:hypothetical protein